MLATMIRKGDSLLTNDGTKVQAITDERRIAGGYVIDVVREDGFQWAAACCNLRHSPDAPAPDARALYVAHAVVQAGIEAVLSGEFSGRRIMVREAAGVDPEALRRAFAVSYTGTHGATADEARKSFELDVVLWLRSPARQQELAEEAEEAED